MTKDPQILAMLARIQASEPNFTPWLQSYMDEEWKKARKARELIDVHWAQGRAQAGEQLISTLKSAFDTLRRVQQTAS
jgi:hypothetical protein